MKNKRFFLTTICSALLLTQAVAQPLQNPHPIQTYIGTEVGTPLFWGDLYSIAQRMHLGRGVGIFAGCTIIPWLSPEISIAGGEGRMAIKEFQTDSYFGSDGIIHYVKQCSSDRLLRDIYVRSSYLQAGVRLRISLLTLVSPHTPHRWDVSVAPAFYFQRFLPVLFTSTDNTRLDGYGITGSTSGIAAGADIGIGVQLTPSLRSHLRSQLMWIDNTAFDGINRSPLWRLNLMLNTSLGISVNI